MFSPAAAPIETRKGTSEYQLDHGIERPAPGNPTYQPTPNLALPDTEFNRKYPSDAYGEEATENARVWKVYRDQRTTSDRLSLDGWNQTLDVLLIFAGLFSAVATAFIVEGYKNLQPDHTEYIANFLYAAARSAANNASAFTLPALDTVQPPNQINVTSLVRWVNGLWFSSLAISLSVALLCILAKQWLYQYDAHLSAPARSLRDWARRHILYYDGLITWGVPAFIAGLQLLMHVSLFVFFVGLVLFVSPLDSIITHTLIALTGTLLVFYIVAMFMPLLHVECPSYTPVLVQMLRARSYFTLLTGNTLNSFLRKGWMHSLLRFHSHNALRWLWRASSSSSEAALAQLSYAPRRERKAITSRAGILDALALRLLLQSSSDPDVVAVGIEAIGAYAPCSLTVAKLRSRGSVVRRTAGEYFAAFRPGVHSTLSYWRGLRSWLCLESVTTLKFTSYFPMRESSRFVAHILESSSQDMDGQLLECTVPLMDIRLLEPTSECFARAQALLGVLKHHNLTVLDSCTHVERAGPLHPATCAMAIQLLPRSKYARKLPWHDLLPLMLHLFHAGRLFAMDEAELTFIVESITASLDFAATTERPLL